MASLHAHTAVCKLMRQFKKVASKIQLQGTYPTCHTALLHSLSLTIILTLTLMLTLTLTLTKTSSNPNPDSNANANPVATPNHTGLSKPAQSATFMSSAHITVSHKPHKPQRYPNAPPNYKPGLARCAQHVMLQCKPGLARCARGRRPAAHG